ncbi:MAG: aldehyde dehydrogenase family protein [Oligoflexus sp.]
MTLTIINPATGNKIREIPTTSLADLKTAFTMAENYQSTWANTDYVMRAKIIQKFRELLAQEKRECAVILSSEMGKPVHQAEGEISACLNRIDWFLESTPRELSPEIIHVAYPMVEEIHYEPLGVIGNISAWNFPYFVGSNVFIPALLTGNTVLYKPSEFASLSGLKIAEIFYNAGLPKEAFQVIIGRGDIGQALVELPIKGIFFTGSYATGTKIAEQAAKRFIKLGVELGGKDAAYVCDDVDVKLAAESVADGSFYNAGQSCCAVERIYVHEKIYSEFLQHFKSFTESLVVGDPNDSKTYMGPLAREAQLAILAEQVEDAVAKGAKIFVQGGRQAHRGYYFSPTALFDVDHSMKLMREESFGPVIGIQKVKDDAEALNLMNDCSYGLTNSVHTKDKQRAMNIMKNLDSGTVYWNCCDRVSPYLPWTGRKASGMGTTLSHIGIKSFLQPKAWHLKHPSA